MELISFLGPSSRLCLACRRPVFQPGVAVLATTAACRLLALPLKPHAVTNLARPTLLVAQVLWDLLLAAGRHSEALRRIAMVHESVTTAFGAGSIEQRMMDVRLGVSIAGAYG